MIELREYVDPAGRSLFARWFDRPDHLTALRIRTVLARLENGNLASLKGVGGGVLEARLDFGPGYRLYLGRDGEALIILLCGGTKARQQRDIETARSYWLDYRQRKRTEG